MTDKDAKISIGAEDDGLKAAMDKAANDVKDAAGKIQGSLGTVNAAFERVKGTFMAFTAALAGGAAFKAVIQTSAEWNLESAKLAKAMGTTTEQASVMKVALNHIGVEQDVLVGASQKMSKQIFANGQAFEKMGIQTKDAAGNYRPITEVMAETNEKLKEIHNPIEQNIAGMQVYGKAWGEVKSILKLTPEVMEAARVRAEQLHLIVGPDGAARAMEYKSQMRDLNLVGKSLEVQFGNALLPVFTKMGAWMGQEAPQMGTIFKNVLLTIAAAGETVWEVLVSIGKTLGAVAAMGVAAMSGDFSGAKDILEDMVSQNYAAGERIRGIWAKAYEDIPGAKSAQPDMEGPNYAFEKEGKGAQEKSRMPGWEAALSEQKAAFMRSHEMYEMSLADEKRYWDQLLATVDKGDKEYGALKKKSADLELQILKKKAQEGRAIAQEEIDAWKASALDGVDFEQQAAQQRFELGLMTKAELIQQEQQFENERFEINRKALEERLALLEKDPNMSPVEYKKLKDQILEVERKHQLQMQGLENKLQLEKAAPGMAVFKSMETSFGNAITGMITRAQTLRQALGSIWQSVFNSFIQKMVAEPLAAMAMRVVRETAIYKLLSGVQITEQATASAGVVGTKVGEAGAVIGANAGEAASGAAASQAAIPIAGPALAAAAFAGTMALVLGAKSLLSARNGFDIPAGLNPVTQLHEREMVLPAAQADAVRDMANGGSSGGGIHIHARHDGDVVRVGDLKVLLTRMNRNFVSIKA